MTEREREIFNLIKKNPLVSQREIASLLGITRSSAGVHIANLMKKGFIKGKGYILPSPDEHICVIGGANMDLQGFPTNSFNLHDSNPGQLKLSLGGVGRNIAENLKRMEKDVKLITAIGNDVYGEKIYHHSDELGIDLDGVLRLENHQTSTYLSILDNQGDMHVAIADMQIMNELTPEYIESQRFKIEDSKICVLDTNLPLETLHYIVNNFKGPDFFVDTVSVAKASKIKDIIGYFHTLKPNIYELEMLTGIQAKNDEDLLKATSLLLEQGVSQVFVTLGEKGVFYANDSHHNRIQTPPVTVVNATGAGDAFTAGLIYSHSKGMDITDACHLSMAASILALSHENTINPNLNVTTIKKKMEDIKNVK